MLQVHAPSCHRSSGMPLCSAAAGIISRAPPALPSVMLKFLNCIPEGFQPLNPQRLGLQETDKALSAPSRFPRLEGLTVWFDINTCRFPDLPSQCRAACEAALAAAHAAGKLIVVWGRATPARPILFVSICYFARRSQDMVALVGYSRRKILKQHGLCASRKRSELLYQYII